MGSEEPQMARGARPRTLIIPSPLPESEGKLRPIGGRVGSPSTWKQGSQTHLPLWVGEWVQVRLVKWAS